MKAFFLVIFCSISSCVIAQQVRPASSAKIYHEIAQLNNLVSVLYVAAHPDDENTRLLAWLVNERHIRTGYLSLTRGDGGQNILGSEQGDALGLIRTHELMEARKVDGAEQFFTRAIDFGFSKTHEETFKHWPEAKLVEDAADVYQHFAPDVIITRFPPDTLAGHGQHAASAIVAAKAYEKVLSDAFHVDDLSITTGTYSWDKPKRIVFNSFKFGSRNTTTEDQFKLVVGDYLPLMGMSTGEIAGASRSVHKSQGAGTPSTPGIQTEYFKLVDGAPFSKSLFEGIDTTWSRVGRQDIGRDIQRILDAFDFKNPDASLPALIAVRKKIDSVDNKYWRRLKLEEIDKVILDCTGFMAELYAKQPEATAGSTLPFTLRVVARSGMPFSVSSIQLPGENKANAIGRMLPQDSLVTFEYNITIPLVGPTQAYSMARERGTNDMFMLRGWEGALPSLSNGISATLNLKIGSQDFPVSVPLSYKKLDPVKGDIVEQLRIVPAATVTFNSSLLIADNDGSVQTDVRIHAFRKINDGKLVLSAYKNEQVSVGGINLSASTDTVITITVPASVIPSDSDYTLTAKLTAGEEVFDLTQHVIQYNHLPTLQYFTQPQVKVLRANWKTRAKHIGYVEGAGDFVPSFLRLAGLQVDILKEADLTHAENLKKYDAVITGIRAVNVEKRMSYWLPVLFEYVQNGGTLVMQYNTLQDLSTTNIGPYPITLSSQRVTEEDAKVTFVTQKHKLLTYPNKITETDFADWVQERGLYFPSKCDEKYTPLFLMGDTGEQPQSNCTLYAKFGKGNYIYTTLSFSRQLPAGNKGAIRLLMNMMSVGK